jgi:hypothetical protein
MVEGVVRVVRGQDLFFGHWTLEAGNLTVQNSFVGILKRARVPGMTSVAQAEAMLLELVEAARRAA